MTAPHRLYEKWFSLAELKQQKNGLMKQKLTRNINQ